MKKIILFLMVLFLVACSNQPEEPKKEEKVVEKETPKPEVKKEPEPEKIYSRFTGLETTAEVVNLRPVMIMIDNHHNARNQASLSKASIIYEMRVEGPYTRYAAIFEKNPNENYLIGPIRSARPNFVELALANNAIYTHYGGSTDGLAMIYNTGVTDVDGGAVEGIATFRYFDTGKYAPHNAYAYLDDLYAYAESTGTPLTEESNNFKFNQEFTELSEAETINAFNFVYDEVYNSVGYEYDANLKKYKRYREEIQMVDELTNDPVMPTNIIVMIADSYIYTDYGHKAFNTIGTGTGYYFTGGKMVPINWSKPDTFTPTTFTYQDGKELQLNPGQTWIEVIDSWMSINY